MGRRQHNPLRILTADERDRLERVSRSPTEDPAHVARAKILLAVANGQRFGEAARAGGRQSAEAVSRLVARFNREGLIALTPRPSGGRRKQYAEVEQARILSAARHVANGNTDRRASWSLTTLQRMLREAPDGLPTVSTHTIWSVLRDAGYTWQRDRSWYETEPVRNSDATAIRS